MQYIAAIGFLWGLCFSIVYLFPGESGISIDNLGPSLLSSFLLMVIVAGVLALLKGLLSWKQDFLNFQFESSKFSIHNPFKKFKKFSFPDLVFQL